MWRYTGKDRPDFAQVPGEGQESVWDYPRPPALVTCERRVLVTCTHGTLADSRKSYRILETASPPTFYVPTADVDMRRLVRVGGASMCEWKGAAHYYALAEDGSQLPVAWAYAAPQPAFASIAEYVSFYPGRVACFVDDERVRPQPGGFYGGWVTDDVAGPVKGEPSTGHW
ncbi:MAG: DUF427 domain-containing protein [Gammaproteobacteria bacterium]